MSLPAPAPHAMLERTFNLDDPRLQQQLVAFKQEIAVALKRWGANEPLILRKDEGRRMSLVVLPAGKPSRPTAKTPARPGQDSFQRSRA